VKQSTFWALAVSSLLIAGVRAEKHPASQSSDASATVQDDALARKVGALELIWKDAESKPAGSAERKKYLEEFLTKSQLVRTLPEDHSAAPGIWLLRAIAGIELDKSRDAWEAGRAMIKLGLDKSTNESVRHTLSLLERKGWLAEKYDEAIAADAKSPSYWLEQATAMKAQIRDDWMRALVEKQIAIGYAATGDPATARRILNTMIVPSNGLHDDVGRWGVVTVLARKGDATGASMIASEIKDPSKKFDTYCGMAEILQQANRYAESAAALSAAEKLVPQISSGGTSWSVSSPVESRAQCLARLGVCYADQRDKQNAARLLDTAMRMVPMVDQKEQFWVWGRLAFFNSMANQFDEARECLKNMIDCDYVAPAQLGRFYGICISRLEAIGEKDAARELELVANQALLVKAGKYPEDMRRSFDQARELVKQDMLKEKDSPTVVLIKNGELDRAMSGFISSSDESTPPLGLRFNSSDYLEVVDGLLKAGRLADAQQFALKAYEGFEPDADAKRDILWNRGTACSKVGTEFRRLGKFADAAAWINTLPDPTLKARAMIGAALPPDSQ
jgi:tetratricopeptide (TPR) repeat protein